MIDKNDVKMPVQRDDIDELLGDEDKMRGVEDLLALVGNTPSTLSPFSTATKRCEHCSRSWQYSCVPNEV